ncbi:hypothetical protein R0K19_23270, partial [Bacillus sp. SIMBA_161]
LMTAPRLPRLGSFGFPHWLIWLRCYGFFSQRVNVRHNGEDEFINLLLALIAREFDFPLVGLVKRPNCAKTNDFLYW